jgi:hypothetical protein
MRHLLSEALLTSNLHDLSYPKKRTIGWGFWEKKRKNRTGKGKKK